MIEEIVTWNKLSTVETAARVLVETDRLGLSKDHHKVTVGEPGLGGGVIDVLREMGVRVRGYNGGATPLRVEKFRNCRAESFWGLWRRLERGAHLVPENLRSLVEPWEGRGKMRPERTRKSATWRRRAAPDRRRTATTCNTMRKDAKYRG